MLSWQLRIAGESVEKLRAECMRYKEVLESRSSAVTVSTVILYNNITCCSYDNITCCSHVTLIHCYYMNNREAPHFLHRIFYHRNMSAN